MQQDPPSRTLRSARLTHDRAHITDMKPISAPDFPFPFDVPLTQVKIRSRAKPSERARSIIELISSDEEPPKTSGKRTASGIVKEDDQDQFEILDHQVNGVSKVIPEIPPFKRITRGRGTIAGGSKPNGLITAIRKRKPQGNKEVPADTATIKTNSRTRSKGLAAAQEVRGGFDKGDVDEDAPETSASSQQRVRKKTGPRRRTHDRYRPLSGDSDLDDEALLSPIKRKKARGKNSSRTSSQQGVIGKQRASDMSVDPPETEDDASDDNMDPRDIGEAFFDELRREIEDEEGTQVEKLDPTGPVILPDVAGSAAEEQAFPPANEEPPAEPLPPAIFGVEDIGHIVRLIISLIPDVCPDHLEEVIRLQVFADPRRRVGAEDVCAEVVALLFDTDLATYPKAKDKKRKADGEAGPSDPKRRRMGGGTEDAVQGQPDEGEAEYLDNGKLNYRSEKARTAERQGWGYRKCVAKDLQNIFSDMSYKHISDITTFHLGLYVPAYIDLAFQHALPEGDRPYRPIKTPRVVDFAKLRSGPAKSKGKGKKMTKADEDGTTVYQEEKEFLIEMLYEKGDNASIESLKVLQPLEGDGDAECQCCFGDDHTEYMVRCREDHQFCRDCLQRLLETALGDQKAPVHCMDGSGCKALFSDREIRKVLAPRMANSYLALVQRKELQAAGIENLETCPSCEFAIVIDNEEEKLFTCQHPECELVSCRACKKPDHIPRTCAEAAADDKLDKRHTIEEAMTEALVRKCPKPSCQKPFLKESGCNKITCGSCGTVSCYVCRAIITNGYQHFDQQPGQHSQKKNKCRLWDPAGGVDPYQEEVANARAQAQEVVLAEAARLGQAIAQPDVDVPLPQDGELGRPRIPGYEAAYAARGHQVAAPPARIAMRPVVPPAREPEPRAGMQVQEALLQGRLQELRYAEQYAQHARDQAFMEVERIRGINAIQERQWNRLNYGDLGLQFAEAHLARLEEELQRARFQAIEANAQMIRGVNAMPGDGIPPVAIPPARPLLNVLRNVWRGGGLEH